jgi:Starch-binding associating with outer membrane
MLPQKILKLSVMKQLHSIYIAIFLLGIFSSSCRKQFAAMNTDPDAFSNVPPEYEFTVGLLAINSNSNEYFYDYDHGIYYWAQSFAFQDAPRASVYTGTANLNQRTGNFYTSVGNQLVDVRHQIDILADPVKAKYVYLRAIVGIPLAYYAWYTSDVQGSIPYTQAFQARYTTPPIFTPQYDTQEALYDTLDNQLKAIVAILKSNQPVTQLALGNQDVYYGGNITSWIKAANSLRLKMAFRLMKQNPAKLVSIATEVLADNVGVISDPSEDWTFIEGASAKYGDDPTNNQPVSGAKNMVDFMWNTKDPRIRVFYKPAMTEDMFDSAKAQGALPATLAWDGQLYRGQFVSPDATKNAAYSYYFSNVNFSYQGAQQSLMYASSIQNYLFYGNTKVSGLITFPLITYADVCFMRAELAVRGLTSENAQNWYTSGIQASLANYDAMAQRALLADYTPLLPAEVSQYLAQPGIAYDPANALEQILDQQYINYFKNQNEAWAVIKRTGYPGVNANLLKLETVSLDGEVQAMPRRFVVTYPSITDLNYKNIISALTAEEQDPDFSTPDDITGRVWWDKK